MEAHAHMGAVVFPFCPSDHHSGNCRFLFHTDDRRTGWARRRIVNFSDVTLIEEFLPMLASETSVHGQSLQVCTKKAPAGEPGPSLGKLHERVG